MKYPSWITARLARVIFGTFVVVVIVASVFITSQEVKIAESLQRHLGVVPIVVGCLAGGLFMAWLASRDD
jgi:hypothetical protein